MKLRKPVKVVLLLILLSVGAFIGWKLFGSTISDSPVNDVNKYNEKARQVIMNNDYSAAVSKIGYNKTLEAALASSDFKDSYFEQYSKIEFQDKEDFISVINSLLDKEYTVDEINNIYKLNEENIVKLLRNDYMDLSDFFGISNFDVDNYERYIKAIDSKTTDVFKRENLKMSDIVTYVNIGLDKAFYSEFKTIENPSDYLVLVNKYNRLPNDYEPSDLETIKTPKTNSDARDFKLRSVARIAFEKLINDALAEGITLFPYSAYRSYSYQSSLYNNYVTRDGQKEADTYSARPGFSEHQLGLAVDIRSSDATGNRLSDIAFSWVKANAHKYGFIIRYPEGQIDITGYVYEDWHLRYLGIEHATKLKDLNITYDEYYDLYIK